MRQVGALGGKICTETLRVLKFQRGTRREKRKVYCVVNSKVALLVAAPFLLYATKKQMRLFKLCGISDKVHLRLSKMQGRIELIWP